MIIILQNDHLICYQRTFLPKLLKNCTCKYQIVYELIKIRFFLNLKTMTSKN